MADGDLHGGRCRRPVRRGVSVPPAQFAARSGHAMPHVPRSQRNNTPIHQLRVEIGHPGDQGDPSRHQLVIGGWLDNPPGFDACLRVGRCTIEILGDLHVTGQILEGPVQADPDDPRFGAALLERWLRALTTAGTQTDAFTTRWRLVLTRRMKFPLGRHCPTASPCAIRKHAKWRTIQLYQTLSVRRRIERQAGSGPIGQPWAESSYETAPPASGWLRGAGRRGGRYHRGGYGPGRRSGGNVMQASDRQTVPIVPSETGPE